jgi:hypothetical protein
VRRTKRYATNANTQKNHRTMFQKLSKISMKKFLR